MPVASKRLLELFRRSDGALVTINAIADGIYGGRVDAVTDSNAARVLVSRTRPRLEAGERIRTVRGRGYVYERGGHDGDVGDPPAVIRDADLRVLPMREALLDKVRGAGEPHAAVLR